MKSITIFTSIILFSVIILISCQTKRNVSAASLNGNWKVISYNNHISNSTITKNSTNTWNDFNNGDITINFNSSRSDEGSFSGTNVTNKFSGKFSLNSSNKISIKDFISTEMNEPEWATLFHQVYTAESFFINDNTLTIYYNQNNNSVSLEKIEY